MPDTLVEWSDDFLVGNAQIDEQHRELVRITNDFWAGCQTGGIIAKVSFLNTIQGAVHYMKTHFAAEEAIMQRAGYPGYGDHKKQHENFVAEVLRQANRFEEEDNPNPGKFSEFLMDWIVGHIARSDKQYIPFIAGLEG
ncbi:MAG: bacteriohemerythrin [Treponema sp.]|jgi:hemerythrin|nr:bacteriohemerythrin [Treponema sp.]